jgi:shikimate kinase
MLKRSWLDTDAMIESKAGRTVAELFADVGEDGFRDLESQAMESLSDLETPNVVSLGGGAILRESNRALLKRLGRVVWLRADIHTIYSRIAGDRHTQQRRPKLSSLGSLEEIATILERRLPMYNASADFSVETSLISTEAVALTIFDWYQSQT